MRSGTVALWLLLCGVACGADGGSADGSGDDGGVESVADADADADAEPDEGTGEAEDPHPPPTENLERDILHIGLAIDLATLSGTATILVAPSTRPGASFEAAGLDVRGVTDADGTLQFLVTDGRLDVGVPASAAATFTVEYAFRRQADFEGLSRRGWTLDWPNFCGNLFPCHSRPSEGQTFALELTGTAAGETAVFPATLDQDAPSYQLAWAVGTFTTVELGTTTAGTDVVAWVAPGREADATTGMADVPAVFDWFERTLGPYPFGDRVGAVAVDWPGGAYGGMEHHPYWHVARAAMADRWVHVHEALHGWYGDGVRIARWEELVLSEGTACYLAARALGRAVGPDAETQTWTDYATELDGILARSDRIAWPGPLADAGALHDFLFSRAPYIKGAHFYRAVAERIGADELDRVLALFFSLHVGEAAGMQDLLDLIVAETGFDPGPLADGWLRSLGRPAP
jgi:hypothetical protein